MISTDQSFLLSVAYLIQAELLLVRHVGLQLFVELLRPQCVVPHSILRCAVDGAADEASLDS